MGDGAPVVAEWPPVEPVPDLATAALVVALALVELAAAVDDDDDDVSNPVLAAVDDESPESDVPDV